MNGKINNLKQIVTKSKIGHLPLKERVDLLGTIGNVNTVNKIFLECAKKVLPIWKNVYPNDTSILETLQKADLYLYKGVGEKADFDKLADYYRNYVEMDNGAESSAGLAAIFLCYNIAVDAAMILNKDEYNGTDDDNEFEWDCWTPDYYASLAYSDGNPFCDEGNINKRREFWNWYLDMVQAICENPNNSILILEKIAPVTDKEEQFVRTQTTEVPSILEKIDFIIETTINIIKKDGTEWESVLLEANCMKGGISYHIFIIKNGQKTQYHKGNGDVLQTFAQIKREMYAQERKEGAWCQCYLSIRSNKEYDFTFNYDDADKFPDNKLRPNNIKYEFEYFPRAKEFTPKWVQNILGKKAKYLKYLNLVIMLLFFGSCTQKSVLDKVADYMDKKPSDTIVLGKFTDFEWDSVLIIRAICDERGKQLWKEKEKEINTQNIEKYDKIRDKGTEVSDVVYFINNKELVYIDIVPKTGFGIEVYEKFSFVFSEKACFWILPKDKAVFKIGKHALYWIYDDFGK
jgi:hypothetical protein